MSMVVGLRNGSFCSIRRPSFAPLHHSAVKHLLRLGSGSSPQMHAERARDPKRKKRRPHSTFGQSGGARVGVSSRRSAGGWKGGRLFARRTTIGGANGRLLASSSLSSRRVVKLTQVNPRSRAGTPGPGLPGCPLVLRRVIQTGGFSRGLLVASPLQEPISSHNDPGRTTAGKG